MPPDAILSPPALSPATAAFIQSGVSVRLASTTALRRPVVGRAIAAWPLEDRRRVTLILDRAANASLIDAVRESGMVAAVFTQPTTHRSLQLKGRDATIHAPDDDPVDLRQVIARQSRAFALELRDIGFAEDFIAAHCAHDAEDLVAVTFTCEGAFDQTPGPDAGAAVTP